MVPGPLMIDIDGVALCDEDRSLLAHPLVGGVIYFSRNFESVEQITALSNEIRQLRPEILIAVDQEGGRVQRFREGFTRLPAMQQFLPLYRKQPEAALRVVKDCAWLMAAEVQSTGVDFSFAPVLDVDDDQCEVIANRSFSPDPHEASALAAAFIAGMNEAGMAATGKHFPGHGGVVEDSHLALPIDYRDFATIEQHDLIPFKDLSSQLAGVMPAHIVFANVDTQAVGFSPYWLQTVLRGALGFDGVIFSDDLTMEGAAALGSYAERAKVALDAGCDMVLVCNSRPGALEVLAELEAMLNNSQLGSDLFSQQAQRLTSMRSRVTWQRNELEQLERYQQVKGLLGAMVGLK